MYGCVTFVYGFSNLWYVCNVDSGLAIKKTVAIHPANKEQGVVFATTRFVYMYYFMFVSLTMSWTSYYCLLQTWRSVFLVIYVLEFHVIAKRYLFIDLQTQFLENVSYGLNIITLAVIFCDYFEMKSNCFLFTW